MFRTIEIRKERPKVSPLKQIVRNFLSPGVSEQRKLGEIFVCVLCPA